MAVPVGLTYIVSWLNLPPFVFEHLIVLLVIAVALPGGLGPAIVAALVSVLSDNILLREPAGRPTITGLRDVFDLALFAMVAVIVSSLVRRAHQARRAAEAAAERERRAREDRTRMIEAITHDLATPLAVLRNSVEFAKRSPANGELDWPRLLARLDTASVRATSLVRLLSDVEALEASEFTLELADHDLRELVGPLVAMMDRWSEQHPVLLSVPDAPVPIRADASRLQRVVENLIGNAIKFSPRGGAVEVSVAVTDGKAVLRVRDYGIGIPAEAMSKIFERSYRVSTTGVPGLGLGLSIAAQVVTRHGGTIAASTADGGGALLEVCLPLAERLPDAPPELHSSHVVLTR